MIASRFVSARRLEQAISLLPWAFLAICLTVSVHYSRQGWNNPLTDPWRFRETQTAWTARALVESGWRVDYETPVLGAPWSIPFEFPTYQLCVAALTKVTGWPLETAGRSVSLLFAYGAFALLGVLVSRAASSLTAGIATTALCLVSPLYLYGSRAFMIESTALFFAVALLLAVHEFLERPRMLPLVATFLAGTLAGPTKATTYLVTLVGIAGLTTLKARDAWPRLRQGHRPGRLLAGFIVALAVPFIFTVIWTHYTDVVKQRNELAAFITSGALREWNFGTWRQRLDFASWEQLSLWINQSILGTPLAWIIAAAVWTSAGIRHGFALVLLAMFASGSLVFTNLYVVHEYYHFATGIYLLALIALGLGALWDRGTFSSRLGAGLSASVLSLLMLSGYVHRTLPHQLRIDEPLAELAEGVRKATPADSVILVYGHEWESTLSYLAGRRAIMDRYNLAPDDPRIQRARARLDRPLGGVVFTAFFRDDWSFILRQLRGLDVGRQRLFSSAAGDVFPASDAPALRADAWQRAGFAEMPGVFESALHVGETVFAGRSAMLIHAPGLMVIDRESPDLRHTLRAGFGITEGAYTGSTPTDGVTFVIDFVDTDKQTTRLFERRLDPYSATEDRGPQSVELSLPNRPGALIFRTNPGATQSCDWSVWRDVQLL